MLGQRKKELLTQIENAKCQSPNVKRKFSITKARKDENTKKEIHFQEETDCYKANSCQPADGCVFCSARLGSKGHQYQDTTPAEFFESGARDTKRDKLNFSCFLTFVFS